MATQATTRVQPSSTASFDLSDEKIANVLTDCKVGEPEELMLTFTPTSISDTMITGTISNVEYNQDEEQAEGDNTEETDTGSSPSALNINKTASYQGA